PDSVINIFCNPKGPGLLSRIFDHVNSRLTNRGEIEMRVFIAHPSAPGLDLALECLAVLTFRSESQHAGNLGSVEERIEFYDRNFGTLGCVADLVVANYW